MQFAWRKRSGGLVSIISIGRTWRNGIHDWYHTLTWNIITLICSYTKKQNKKTLTCSSYQQSQYSVFFEGLNSIRLCTCKQINSLPMAKFSTLMVCLVSPLWPDNTETKTLWGHRIRIALKLCLSMRAATNEDVVCRLVMRLFRSWIPV